MLAVGSATCINVDCPDSRQGLCTITFEKKAPVERTPLRQLPPRAGMSSFILVLSFPFPAGFVH